MSNGNTVELVGNITRDPELRFTSGGTAVATFGLAVNRRWRNAQSNEWEEQTSFFDIVCWRELAENVSESLTRGSRVMVVGRLEQRSWETPEGDKRSKIGIVADSVDISVSALSGITRKQRESGNNSGGGRTAPQRQQTADDPF